MPEYGRNVQAMVEYALTIENKEERTVCVNSIIRTMTNLFPYLRDEQQRHKIYDHLAVMSGFRLDIDSEYQPVDAAQMHYQPQQIEYRSNRPLHFRHYGRLVEEIIHEAVNQPDEELKKQLIIRAGNRMKQNYLQWNKEAANDDKIKADIMQLSGGQLNCDFPEFVLQDPTAQQQNNGKKKKKR